MRKLAAILAFVGGALLIYAGLSGNAELWATIAQAIKPFIEDPGQRAILELVIRILMVVASLGGLAVIGGGVALLYDKELLGQVLIFLGAATGLIGLVIGIALTLAGGGTFVDYFANRLNGTAGLLGVLISYGARKAV